MKINILKQPFPMLLARHFIALVLGFYFSLSIAQPVRNKVLEEVNIIHTDGYHAIEIQLPFRFRYLSHFPDDTGKELRIRIQPVNVPASDKEAISKRESFVPRYAEAVALDEVIYEGDLDTGAQLTLLFTDNVFYEVIPGADYRYIRIVILSIK